MLIFRQNLACADFLVALFSVIFGVCSRLDKPFERVRCTLAYLLSNPQTITCIIFENLFGPYFLPHQSHSYGYAPSSGENLTSKMSFKSDATYYFHIT